MTDPDPAVAAAMLALEAMTAEQVRDEVDRLILVPLLRAVPGMMVRRFVSDDWYMVTVDDRESPFAVAFGGPLSALGDGTYRAGLVRAITDGRAFRREWAEMRARQWLAYERSQAVARRLLRAAMIFGTLAIGSMVYCLLTA